MTQFCQGALALSHFPADLKGARGTNGGTPSEIFTCEPPLDISGWFPIR